MFVRHKGYTARSYGLRTVSIYDEKNREVYKTNKRKFANTEEELIKIIELYLDLNSKEEKEEDI